MKRIFAAAMIGGLAMAPAAWANDAHHPDKAAGAENPMAVPGKPAMDSAAQRMQENVKRMQSQVDAIRGAKDPAERDRLLAEHAQAMRENMALGQSMMNGGGMGMMGGPGGMGMMGGPGGMGMKEQCMKMMAGPQVGAPGMAMRLEQMEKRMDMMQMMMGRMAGRTAPRTGDSGK